MYPQPTIDALLQSFMQRMAGCHVEYHGYAGEALSLARRWVDTVQNGQLDGPENAPPPPDGFASSYWTTPPPALQDSFTAQPYDPEAAYPAGSLVVATAQRHIGILVDNTPGMTTAMLFEQNDDPVGSAAHSAQRPKDAIDGILVLNVQPPVMAPPRPASSILTYQKAPATPKTTKTTVRNYRTGLTYKLFTQKNEDTNEDEPIFKRYYVINKGGTVKRSFGLGMSPAMPVIGEPLKYRDPVDLAGTVTNRTGVLMYMTPADMGDMYNTWRVAHDSGYIPEDLGVTQPGYEVTNWDAPVTPPEPEPTPDPTPTPVPVKVTPKPDITPKPQVPSFMANEQPDDSDWELKRDLPVTNLLNGQQIGLKRRSHVIHIQSWIPIGTVLYARLAPEYTDYDKSKVYVVVARTATGIENLVEAMPRNQQHIQELAKRYMSSFFGKSKQIMDVITSKEKTK